jgi:hypothetical protein
MKWNSITKAHIKRLTFQIIVICFLSTNSYWVSQSASNFLFLSLSLSFSLFFSCQMMNLMDSEGKKIIIMEFKFFIFCEHWRLIMGKHIIMCKATFQQIISFFLSATCSSDTRLTICIYIAWHGTDFSVYLFFVKNKNNNNFES